MKCTPKHARRSNSSCRTTEKPAHDKEITGHADDFQAFPFDGPLLPNFNIGPKRLRQIADLNPSGEVYAYILTTATWDAPLADTLTQRGSAPNFQGGRITLCTCKHAMRAGRLCVQWPGTWIAGFCSGARNQPYGLFYLMRVGEAFESHIELWNALSSAERTAKSVARNSHGDVFEPQAGWSGNDGKGRFKFKNYRTVCESHVHARPKHPNQYRQDFDFREHDRCRRAAPLLLGEIENSVLWSKPCFEFRGKPARTRKFHSLANLIVHLKEIA